VRAMLMIRLYNWMTEDRARDPDPRRLGARRRGFAGQGPPRLAPQAPRIQARCHLGLSRSDTLNTSHPLHVSWGTKLGASGVPA
jgi:hypothetical protein